MDNDTNENKRNARGRPSKPEQLQTDRELRSLFIRGVRPYHAAIETGHSRNTIKEYYRKSYKAVNDLEGPEFAQACKERIVSACLGIDNQISKLEKIQEELELKSKNGGTQDIKLYKLQISLSNSISDLIIKRLGIANSPTYDDMLAAMREVEKQK